jgi:hypothetical protein
MSPPYAWENSGIGRKVIRPSAGGLDPEPPPVGADGDVAVKVGAEDGVAVQALQNVRRGVTVGALPQGLSYSQLP